MATRTGPWVEVTRARAQAEFAELAWLLTEYTTGVAAIDEPQSWHGRSEEMGVVMDLALATGYSEQQMRNRLSTMRTVRDHLPATWLSFRAGDIDATRTTQLANAAKKLQRPDSLVRLDQNGSTYAAGHNNSELRRWITRFCATVEPVETNEASEKARGLRHVRVHHDGDGMAWLNAFIPSAVAAAADRRLNQAARVLEDEPDEPRSLQHKRADLLGAWLTHGDETVSTPTVHMDVAVTVPVEALAGHSDLPVAAYGHSWTMPADWLAALAGTGNTLWHRIVTDPAGGVLDPPRPLRPRHPRHRPRLPRPGLHRYRVHHSGTTMREGPTPAGRSYRRVEPRRQVQVSPPHEGIRCAQCRTHEATAQPGPPPDEHRPSTCCSMENHALAAALVEYFDREQTAVA